MARTNKEILEQWMNESDSDRRDLMIKELTSRDLLPSIDFEEELFKIKLLPPPLILD